MELIRIHVHVRGNNQTNTAISDRCPHHSHVKFVCVRFLTKKGYVVKNWKKRYFVLSGDSLFYFKEEADATPQGKSAGKQPLGMIPVRDARIGSGEQLFAWTLQPARSQRKFILVASNASDAERWISDLQKASLGATSEIDLEAKMREQERDALLEQQKRITDDQQRERDIMEKKQRDDREESDKRERIRLQLLNNSIPPPPSPSGGHHYRSNNNTPNNNNNQNFNKNNAFNGNSGMNGSNSTPSSPNGNVASPKQGSGLALGLRTNIGGNQQTPNQQQSVASPVHGIASPLSPPAGFNSSAASAASSGGGSGGRLPTTLNSVAVTTGSGGNKTPPPVPPYTPTTMARISMAMSASSMQVGSANTGWGTVTRSHVVPVAISHSRIDSSSSAASSAASASGIAASSGMHGRIESSGQGRFVSGGSVYTSPSEVKDQLMRPSGGHSILGAPAKFGIHRPQLSTTDTEQITVDPLGDNVKEGYVLRLYPGAWKKVYLVLQRPSTMAQFKSHKLLVTYSFTVSLLLAVIVCG
jgi:hypothetical protein